MGVFYLVSLLYDPTVPKRLMIFRIFCIVLWKKNGIFVWYQKLIDATRNTLAITFSVHLGNLVNSALGAFCVKNYVLFCVMNIDHHNFEK